MNYESILTARQIEILDAYHKHNRHTCNTAKALNVTHQTVSKTMKAIYIRLAKAGIAEDMNVSQHVPPGYQVKGTSTLVGGDGNVKLRWVKTDRDTEKQLEIMREVVDTLKDEVPAQSPIVAPSAIDEDLLNLYTITDYHIGAYAWAEETGGNWSTEIAEDLLVKWFERAIALSPASSTAVFGQLGDFMHWDGIEAVTPTSKHILDADTRFHKLVRVTIRVLRRIVNLLLSKHKQLHVIMAEGNHDIASSIWLSELIATLYRDEPRITVDTNPDPYYCHEFGSNALFFHHGHKRRVKNVSDVFVAKYREVFGRTKHAYAHMGHLHHDMRVENNLMIVEQHRTLAAPDSHASRGGWMSGRDAKVITYHREYGEVGRTIVNYDQIKDS